MKKTKSLVPTFTTAAGLLLGGLLGACVGWLIGSESAVVMSYVVGVLAGSATGAWAGYRLISPAVTGSQTEPGS